MWTENLHATTNALKVMFLPSYAIVSQDTQAFGYANRIAVLESSLEEQLRYKQALVVAHVEQMTNAQQEMNSLKDKLQRLYFQAARSGVDFGTDEAEGSLRLCHG